LDMHDILVNELEKHLGGGASQAFYDHLETCSECRAQVARMDGISRLFDELKPEPAPEALLGFYNRVAGRIVETQRKEAWGLFSPGAVFFRRIAFASLLLLAGLGGFLVTRESSAGGADAAAIMAQEDTAGAQSQSSERDHLLVTLATYQE
jgi:anti-sigma factor RsiW